MSIDKPWFILLVVSLFGCDKDRNENDTLPTDTATATDSSSDTTPSEEAGEEEAGEEAGEGSTSGGDSTGAPAGECGDGTCAQAAPDGWFGPLVRFDSDESEMPPLCNEDWPDQAFSLLAGWSDPGPSTCTCSCGLDVSGMCNSYAYLAEGTDTCGFTNMVPFNDEAECEAVSVADGSIYLYAFNQGMPFCGSEITEEKADVPWTHEVSGCRGAEWGAACGEGNNRQCLPKVPDGYSNTLCVFQEGDHECPGGDYTEKTMLYSGADDTRNCSPCACDAPPAGATCTGTWQLFDNDDCTGTMLLETANQSPGCAGAVTGLESVRLAYDGPTDCGIFEDTTARGEIAPAGEMTYCCTAG